MKPSKSLPPSATVFAVLLAALSGACTVFPDSPPARLYSVELAGPVTAQTCAQRFAVRELRLPGYLDRHEVLLGLAGNRVEVSAQHLWASPLTRELTRLLSQGLQERLGGASAMPYPVRLAERPDWVVVPEITRVSYSDKDMTLQLQVSSLRLDSNGVATPGSRSLDPILVQVRRPIGGEGGDNSARAERSARSLGEAVSAALEQLAPRLARQWCPPS